MKRQNLTISLFALAILVLVSSCANPVASNVSAASVTLNKQLVSLYVGESETVTATIAPTNASNKGVTWTSVDPAVAEVNASGVVTGKKVGQTAIRATTDDGDFVAECGVVVSAYNVTSVTLNKATLSMSVHELYQLVATVLPSYATNKAFTWSSSDESVVIPVTNDDGMIFAIGPGQATITVTAADGGKTAQCVVTVTQ